MESKLETFWSPELILAVKRYVGVYDNEGLYQSAIKLGHPFELGKWYKAECRSPYACDNPPALEHRSLVDDNPYSTRGLPLCGFYGWKRFARKENAEWWYHPQDMPNLLVEFKGRVVEHEKGYRAEYQRIVRVLSPWEIKTGIVEELVPELGDTYNG